MRPEDELSVTGVETQNEMKSHKVTYHDAPSSVSAEYSVSVSKDFVGRTGFAHDKPKGTFPARVFLDFTVDLDISITPPSSAGITFTFLISFLPLFLTSKLHW